MSQDEIEGLEREIGLETRAVVHAQADTIGVLLAALFQSHDLTKEQVRWVVNQIGELGQRASNDSKPVRRAEGVMLRVIAGQLKNATQEFAD